MTTDKSREQRARRRAKRLGFSLWKIRGRDAFVVVPLDARPDFTVARGGPIEGIEEWLDEREQPES